jgi:cytochrome P450
MNGARFNLLSPEVRRDPFPLYRRLRNDAPVAQVDPGGIWAVARHAEVVRALQDTETYSSRGFQAAFAPPWLEDRRLAKLLIALDPPEHTALRAVLRPVFSRELLGRLEQPLRGFFASVLDQLGERRDIEAIGELAAPIASAVVALMLDLDASLHARFKQWNDAIAMLTPVEPPAAVAATIRTALREQEAYFLAVIEERAQKPGNDVVSQLLGAKLGDRAIERDEVVVLMSLLLGAGIDTTVHLLSKSLLVLSSRPALTAELQRERARIPPFVEEMLRYDPPTHGLLRVTTRETELGGERLPAGALVLLLLASANRDEAVFEQPEEFRLDRHNHHSVAFGHGAHACLGAALARFETRVVLDCLLDRFDSFERDPAADIEWDFALHTRGPLKLPLRLHDK